LQRLTSHLVVALERCCQVANNTDVIKLEPGGFMETYLGKAKDLPPADKCEALEQSEGVAEKHEAAAQEGQTDAAEHSDVNAHFICITSCDGQLFELDGRKGIPINHGPTTPGVCARRHALAIEFSMLHKTHRPIPLTPSTCIHPLTLPPLALPPPAPPHTQLAQSPLEHAQSRAPMLTLLQTSPPFFPILFCHVGVQARFFLMQRKYARSSWSVTLTLSTLPSSL
jgi:hypothetical protein